MPLSLLVMFPVHLHWGVIAVQKSQGSSAAQDDRGIDKVFNSLLGVYGRSLALVQNLHRVRVPFRPRRAQYDILLHDGEVPSELITIDGAFMH